MRRRDRRQSSSIVPPTAREQTQSPRRPRSIAAIVERASAHGRPDARIASNPLTVRARPQNGAGVAPIAPETASSARIAPMAVHPMPGLEHLPFAEVWLDAIDDERWRAASDAARALGKSGLEVWTTDRTPEVAAFLGRRGYEEVRRYVVSELDVAAAPDPGEPRHPLVTLAERPELAPALYELARVAYPDQPGRADTRIDEAWFEWGLRAHAPDSYFVALAGERLLGYGYLERRDGAWWNGFMAVVREARGSGVAGAIKRAQIRWAKEHDVASLRTANEVRLVSMLELNRRLGYRRLYEEIVLRGPAA
jgi:GNAT superfamily N-acetyltransferase